MAEESNKTEEPEEKEPEALPDAAVEPIATIDKANEAAERMERANKKKEELLLREEKLEVNRRLGGTSEAGATKLKKKELSPEEYADLVMKGEVNPLADGKK